MKRLNPLYIDLGMRSAKSSLCCRLLVPFAICSLTTASEKPIDVSFRQLVLNPGKFDGKRISVHGYFDGTDTAALRASATTGPQTRDILLDLRSELARKLTARRFLKGYVDVTGTFQSYKPAPLNPKPIPGNSKYVTVTGNVGFGYAGFRYQIINITQFSPCRVPSASKSSIATSARRRSNEIWWGCKTARRRCR